ncbi:MAG: extracellular solute-binding protein [Pseudomonadota bacterium]
MSPPLAPPQPTVKTGGARGWTRALLAYAAAALTTLAFAFSAQAAPRHGLSPFGDLKYPAGFKHFDYVNPSAPKGGKLSMIGTAGITTFDSFNAFIREGDAAQGLSFLFDSLMVPAGDEPGSVYGLVARTAEIADDKKAVTFVLRKAARFSDGSKLTAADVVFSFDILKKDGAPVYRNLLRDVVKAEALDDYTVRYTFKGDLVRNLPVTVATLPILSKAYYSKRRFKEVTLEPPLGSGPYKIEKFDQGRFIAYSRRTDYWAKDLPVNVGRFNFNTLRYEYYLNRSAELESLKSGNYDLREEFTSKDWATAYNIRAVRNKQLIRLTLPDKRPGGAQGFFINTRRDKFKDVRVRKALDFAFDFETTNKNLFFSLYKRTQSFFENSDMKASGKPSPAELALLEPFRDKLPPEVFAAPYEPPSTDGSGNNRAQLREAFSLLRQAGFKPGAGGVLRDKKGQPLTIEFLTFSPSFDKIINTYIRNLRRLGIQATIRRVDSAQYQRRVKSFDFDITTRRYVLAMTPGVEMRNYWGSAAADIQGSLNISGVKDPVIDALTNKMIAAKSRKELVTAARAFDRVWRAGHYWVPQWYKAAHNVVYWDKFARPARKPDFARGIIDLWWYDEGKADELAKARGQ